MKCKFCQQECTIGEYDGVYGKTSTIYECNRHPVVIKHYVHETYHKQGDCTGPDCCPKKNWHATIIFLEYKGEKYQANWFPGNRRYPGPSFRLDWTTPFHVINGGSGHGKVIFELPFHPADVTPENVTQKLATWLTFS